MSSSDDLRRFAVKNYTDIKEKVLIFFNVNLEIITKFQNYLQETTEMDSIIESFLKDDQSFRESLNPPPNSQKEQENSLQAFYDNEFYNKYDWKSFNQQKIILYKAIPPKKEIEIEDQLRTSLKNVREMSQIAMKLRTMLTVPNALQKNVRTPVKPQRSNKNKRESVFTLEDERAKESLELNSFFSNESTFARNNATSFLSLKSLMAQSQESRKKDLRLISKRYYREFSQEHKPKVLTTDKCKK